MSHAVAPIACAVLLLAIGARAAEPDEPAAAPAASRIVKIFVTMRDDAGKVLAKASVRIESDDSSDVGVGPDGAKLSFPANHEAVVKVLFPGGNCSVTLSPKAISGGRVAIGVDRKAAGQKCAIEDAAQAGQPASAPASRPSHSPGDGDLAASLL